MLKPKICPLIFTDLDGTLLDHHSYSAEPAASFIETLFVSSIAEVIPVTSKTWTELVWLDRELPFRRTVKISENGSAIYSPKGCGFGIPETKILGVAYDKILEAIDALPARLRREIRGFGDMNANEVMHHTGLNPGSAERAKAREASEPFLWSGTNEAMSELSATMAPAGIQIQQGGRFFHFTGMATKWDAVQVVTSAFRKTRPEYDYRVIALGDGPNDLQMIEGADYGVIIPNQRGAAIRSDKPSVRVAQQAGPAGWVAVVTDILQELDLL